MLSIQGTVTQYPGVDFPVRSRVRILDANTGNVIQTTYTDQEGEWVLNDPNIFGRKVKLEANIEGDLTDMETRYQDFGTANLWNKYVQEFEFPSQADMDRVYEQIDTEYIFRAIDIVLTPKNIDSLLPLNPCILPVSCFYFIVWPCTNDMVAIWTSSGNYSKIEWDFGDGNKSEGKIVTHTYNTFGTFRIQHRVYHTRPVNGCMYTETEAFVTIEPLLPNVSMIIDCSSGITTTEVKGDCHSCKDCTCADQANCNCVSLEKWIRIKPIITT